MTHQDLRSATASETPPPPRGARLSSRIYWDGGALMHCPVCGLVVPVYVGVHSVVDGRPVDHYPEFDEHAYYPGAFCRGARHSAVLPATFPPAREWSRRAERDSAERTP